MAGRPLQIVILGGDRDAAAHCQFETAGVVNIDAARRADAHSELSRWLSGDRRTNNELPGRAI